MQDVFFAGHIQNRERSPHFEYHRVLRELLLRTGARKSTKNTKLGRDFAGKKAETPPSSVEGLNSLFDYTIKESFRTMIYGEKFNSTG